MRRRLRRMLMQAGHDTPGAAAAVVREAAQLAQELRSATAEAVGRARALGVTWDDLAAALGVTRSAAIQRYGEGPARPRG